MIKTTLFVLGITKITRRLLKTAVPTQNLPKSSLHKNSPIKRLSPKKRSPVKKKLMENQVQ